MNALMDILFILFFAAISVGPALYFSSSVGEYLKAKRELDKHRKDQP